MTLLPFYRQFILSSAAFALIALASPSYAYIGCQLQKGYELPEDVEFYLLCSFNSDLAPAYNSSTNKYGAVNRQGKTVIPFVYELPIEFVRGRALVKKEDQWLLINTKNRQLAQFDFDDAGNFRPSGLASFKKNNRWGYINTDGKIIVEPQFDDIYRDFGYAQLNNQSDTVAIFEKNGKQGALAGTGKIIIPAQFDEVSPENDVLLVSNGEKMGVYDYQGRMIHPVEFEKENHAFRTSYGWTDQN